MREQKVPRRVEQRIVIKFLVGENVPSAEIHHRLQQQYGELSVIITGVTRNINFKFEKYFPFRC
jgi:hypothetical protein